MLRRKPAPWGSSLGRHIQLFGTPPQLAVPMGALPRGATNAPCASAACGHIVLPHAPRMALAACSSGAPLANGMNRALKRRHGAAALPVRRRERHAALGGARDHRLAGARTSRTV